MSRPRPATTRFGFVAAALAGVLALGACAQAEGSPAAASQPAGRATQSLRPASTVNTANMVWMGDLPHNGDGMYGEIVVVL